MSFNLFDENSLITSPTFATSVLSTYNEDGYGQMVDNCFKSLNSPQFMMPGENSTAAEVNDLTPLDDYRHATSTPQVGCSADEKPRTLPGGNDSYDDHNQLLLKEGELFVGAADNEQEEYTHLPRDYNIQRADEHEDHNYELRISLPQNSDSSCRDHELLSFEKYLRHLKDETDDQSENELHNQRPVLVSDKQRGTPENKNYVYKHISTSSYPFTSILPPPNRSLNSVFNNNRMLVPKVSYRLQLQKSYHGYSRSTRPLRGSKNKLNSQRKFSYEGYTVPTYIEDGSLLVNTARNEEPEEFPHILAEKLLELSLDKEEEICMIRRDRYVRQNLKAIEGLYKNVDYELNPKFEVTRPYEPQYIRYEVDPSNGLAFNETRCGLCPYCPHLNFKNLKTSTYAQHLALTHGVYTDNYLTPNPFYYGLYVIRKTNLNRKTKSHEHKRCGVVCPCCYEIVGTECSKTTASSKPLNNYMRHFRENHRQSKNKLDASKFFNKTSFLLNN